MQRQRKTLPVHTPRPGESRDANKAATSVGICDQRSVPAPRAKGVGLKVEDPKGEKEPRLWGGLDRRRHAEVFVDKPLAHQGADERVQRRLGAACERDTRIAPVGSGRQQREAILAVLVAHPPLPRCSNGQPHVSPPVRKHGKTGLTSTKSALWNTPMPPADPPDRRSALAALKDVVAWRCVRTARMMLWPHVCRPARYL